MTLANQPDRLSSPLNAVSGWKLDVLIRDFARFINAGVALLYSMGGEGRPPTGISSSGLGATHQEIAHPREGGFVGRVLHPYAQRAALESLDRVLDARLIHAKDLTLTHAVALPIRLAIEVGVTSSPSSRAHPTTPAQHQRGTPRGSRRRVDRCQSRQRRAK